MKIAEACVSLLSCILLLSGRGVYASSYDYSATMECLAAPERARYGGGIIEFTQGTNGSKFISVHNKTRSLQTVTLANGNLYTFSAWIRLGKGSESEAVAVVFNASGGKLIHGGETIAKQGCWSLLKGGIVAEFSGHVDVLLMSRTNGVEIWVDNVSLKPFTAKQWRSHQEKSIHKVRRKKVSFEVTYANKTAVDGALISIHQTDSGFPLGCGMNHHILTSEGYRRWFASRFKVTSFTNEMKWYSTEKIRGKENYTVADAMVKFTEQNGISIRGHNVFWDNKRMQPKWVKDLPPAELMNATTRRLNSVVSRYAGKLTGWDVVNENLHFRFFEDKLGENASYAFYSMAYHLDPNTTLFMNEYNTIENSKDHASTASKYKEKLQKILSFPGNKGLKAAIGLQGHFGAAKPNIAYMRSALDILGTMGLPIWLTEVDVKGPNQAQYLEDILREAYSHPAVEGIIIFGGPKVSGFDVMTLADSEFKPTRIGEVVDKLIKEWKSGRTEIRTDSRGWSEVSLFHGDYKVNVYHPLTGLSTTISLEVTKDMENTTVLVQFGV
ncbi:endo-1,4-beta-xylanase 5-like isoform X2 [Hibiscus syriacus]|uniref:endo-1,4-beta-xylanase 5-like isoform X2 n=1 Tax=Hibiscus syriacus TaxID=106335 RepID=UPI001922D0F0|nr:endo-1,4-beta-xylanase 5-like isoform X2 [Hibiscus syriacus]